MDNILFTKQFAKYHYPPHLQVTQDIVDRIKTTNINHNTIIYDFNMENFYLVESRNGVEVLRTKKPLPIKNVVLRRGGKVEVRLGLATYSIFYNSDKKKVFHLEDVRTVKIWKKVFM